MESYSSQQEYLHCLESRSALPEGFLAATKGIRFSPKEREAAEPLPMNISLIVLDEETPDFAGVFTKNRFPGVPVLMGRERLGRKTSRGVLINNKISNVCSPDGRRDADRVLSRLSGLIGAEAENLFTASTGIIGWSLPVEEMEAALPELVRRLDSGSILGVAQGIMTTDSFPKLRRAVVGRGSIVGIAKGAGMIEPNMGTLLCFICTDLELPRAVLQEELSRCVGCTLNRISVDGDQSTSDMALLFSSGRRGKADRAEFHKGLMDVLWGLAGDIVRNAEGAGHVIRVSVMGGKDEQVSAAVGKAVVNSPLVKTAVFGNDPNVGRIICALGDYLGNAQIPLDISSAVVRLGGTEIFSRGAFRLDTAKEMELSQYLREAGFDPKIKGFPQNDRNVDIQIVFDESAPAVETLGTDLSYEYVRENSDYRS
jgi:glutamate N-acetyltransferase/amino-acid N-acetyltransferase